MNASLLLSFLSLTRSVVDAVAQQRGGNTNVAIEIIKSADVSQFGLGRDTLRLIAIAKAGLGYLASRGVTAQYSLGIIKTAMSEGRDVTTEEVSALLSLVNAELDETQQLIDNSKG